MLLVLICISLITTKVVYYSRCLETTHSFCLVKCLFISFVYVCVLYVCGVSICGVCQCVVHAHMCTQGHRLRWRSDVKHPAPSTLCHISLRQALSLNLEIG